MRRVCLITGLLLLVSGALSVRGESPSADLSGLRGGGAMDCNENIGTCTEATEAEQSCGATPWLSCTPCEATLGCISGDCDNTRFVYKCGDGQNDCNDAIGLDCGEAAAGTCNVTSANYDLGCPGGTQRYKCTASITCNPAAGNASCKPSGCGIFGS